MGTVSVAFSATSVRLGRKSGGRMKKGSSCAGSAKPRTEVFWDAAKAQARLSRATEHWAWLLGCHFVSCNATYPACIVPGTFCCSNCFSEPLLRRILRPHLDEDEDKDEDRTYRV